MEQRVPTIFEVAEAAARRQQQARPEAGAHQLKANRKASPRTSRRPAGKKRRKAGKRKTPSRRR